MPIKGIIYIFIVAIFTALPFHKQIYKAITELFKNKGE